NTFGGLGPFKRDFTSFDELISQFDTEIRKNISESANWMPKLIISEPTNITFKLPDNIGEWTIRVVGNNIFEDSNGLVLWGDVETVQIKSFLPFFVEFEIPQPVVQDDILNLKGYIYNYIGTDVYAMVAINAPNLIILNKDVQELYIPNEYVSEVEFSVYCIEPYLQNITLLAATEVSGMQYSDAKQLTTYIKPNGIEVVNRTIGFLNASDGSLLLNYTLDSLAIYHKETLAIYTDLMDISIDSWQSLIGYPYGCIEQTISKALPTALIFNYLKQTGELTPDLEQELISMILEGLNRIYHFQHSDGGWGWWRNDASKIIMTSIVVSALIQIEEIGFQINSFILKKGIDYLINHQHPNGLWDFQEYSSNTLEATAFVLKAIMNFQNKTSQIDTAISQAVSEFNNIWYTEEMQSAYAASLFYIATNGNVYENTTFNDLLIQFIKDNKKIEDDTIYWDSDVDNIWYWRKLGNIVEITSYATLALAIDDYVNNYALIQKAVRYLLNRRNRWGWGSTADTAAAIIALTAIRGIILTGGFIDFNGTISIIINDQKPPQYILNFTESNNKPDEILVNLQEYIMENTNTINISLDGSGQICYIFESIQILRSSPIIEIADIIEVSKNEHFYLGVRFSEIDDRMPIVDITSLLLQVPQNFQDPGANYTIFTPIIINGTEIFFSLIAPNIEGDYVLEGVSVLGFIQFIDTSDNSSRYQIFQRTVGPIIIRVGTQSLSSYPLIGPIHSSAAENSELLSLTKQVSKQDFLVPGEIITVTLQISNDGDPRQFYVLEDELPTGTIFLSDSVEISGDYNNSEITHGLFLSGIHFFFPMLATGITEITYQLQVDNIKNSYSGECKLWGMYDDICISAHSVVLENVPRKHYTNHSIYQDLLQPLIIMVFIKYA
ncbi:MAG: alpha-2-macroglobulin family protein, partial [Candidatus Hodarchaeota archaeon]